MEQNLKFEKLLALLLVKKAKVFQNSYDFVKVLAWKFGIIEHLEIVKLLLSEQLITEKLAGAIHHYNITEAGTMYLQENQEWLERELKSRYPNELEFINGILHKADA